MFFGASGSATKKLPFEKPIFESELLNDAKKEQMICDRIEFYGNLAVIAAGLSVVAKVGYYIVHGKEGGAGPLPRRDRASSGMRY